MKLTKITKFIKNLNNEFQASHQKSMKRKIKNLEVKIYKTEANNIKYSISKNNNSVTGINYNNFIYNLTEELREL